VSEQFAIGVQDGWHAIPSGSILAGCTGHRWAACGALVRTTKYEQPYDPRAIPVSFDPCPDCLWIAAARSGMLDAALAMLTHPVAHDAAAGILNLAGRMESDDDDPACIQLLAAVTRHAPVALVSEECSEGDCEHEGNCPETLACRACSLQAGGWAGEWEGRYREECTIPGPCAPLLAIAEHVRAEVERLAVR
jgi:hypothetical protein